MKHHFDAAFNKLPQIPFNMDWVDHKGGFRNLFHKTDLLSNGRGVRSVDPTGRRMVILPDYEAGGTMTFIEGTTDIFFTGDKEPVCYHTGRPKMNIDEGRLDECERAQFMLKQVV